MSAPSPRVVAARLVETARREAAERAWDSALRPARLPFGDPFRVSYPEAAKAALAAYDAVIRVAP